MNIKTDVSAQASTELILLFAGIIVVVLIFMNIYQNYIIDFSDEIKQNEMNTLIKKIDDINEYIK